VSDRRLSPHGSEIILLGLIALGVIYLLARAISHDKLQGLDVAAFLLVLQSIIQAIKDRWSQRSVDQMSASLANAPPAEPPAREPQP